MNNFFKQQLLKDNEDKWLLLGLTFSLVLIAWFQFIAYDMKEVVPRGQQWSDLIVNISMSYIAGWIIYIVSVFIPKIEKWRKAKKIVYPFLNQVITTIDVSILNSVLYPNEQYRPIPKVSTMSSEELRRCFDFEILNKPIKGFHAVFYTYGFKPETRLDELILSTITPLENVLNELKAYYDMLSYDEVKLLTEIEKSRYLLFVGGTLRAQNKLVFDVDMFIELFESVRSLELLISHPEEHT
ncbi:hypothetical protein [Pseudoalteromonas luteoviolacea]|uniref:Uncharacterized protein n=1 Tax=Pseudoalteromonas luteoviolacea (strain 2ta16) TaxID=1353533 RepID=V4HS66_PSEL2|nr:hypothetical protein [Pseudoalteromonas luteoviolacea]ESP93675.1 hypothetical protein PL2TA16_02879 [Pseudoalteromonas luteoviolacea 2ta16]KZN41207.1 hypothetical protein N483_16480 [Pseudoalteromonas luteoviolacea NCIMB 1944]